jgi:hypothetical protein
MTRSGQRITVPRNKGVFANNQVTSRNRPTTFTLSHQELYGEHDGTQLFTAQIKPIRMDDTILPWVSKIASCFDEWRIVKMSLKYEAATNAIEKGTVTLAWDKNPSDTAPITYAQIMNYAHMAPTKSNLSIALPIPQSEWKYINTVEPSRFSHGSLIVATEGQTDTTALGKTIMHYTIQFRTAQQPRVTSATLSKPPTTNLITGWTGNVPRVGNTIELYPGKLTVV